MLVTCTLFASMHAHFPKGDLWASLMHQILVDLNQRLDIESMLHRNGISLQRNVSESSQGSYEKRRQCRTLPESSNQGPIHFSSALTYS